MLHVHVFSLTIFIASQMFNETLLDIKPTIAGLCNVELGILGSNPSVLANNIVYLVKRGSVRGFYSLPYL